jgi:thiol-disulfide isomerase/thioredoxin/protocatechuate 3,4-dioxygenase beta subunit
MQAIRHSTAAYTALLLLAASAEAADPAGEFHGRVIDRAGSPVAGAEVVVRIRHLNGWDMRRARADAEGRFTIRDLKEGRGHLFARAGDDRVGLASVAHTTRPDAGEATVTLAEPRAFRVRAADPDGRRLAGASIRSVELTTPDGKVTLRRGTIEAFSYDWLPSKEDGLLGVTGLPATGAGAVKVDVTHPEFVRSAPVEVLPEAPDPPTARLARGGRLVVRLRAEGIEVPERGLEMTVFRSGEAPYLSDEPFAPDDGRIELIVPPGTYSGMVRGPGVQTLPVLFENIAVTATEPGEITITLTPRGLVRGRVLDAKTSEPIARCVVSAMVRSDKHDTDPYGYGPGWYHSAHAVTDAQGSYEITPGVGLVRLRARTARPVEPSRIEVEVPPDRPVEVPSFRIAPPPRLTGVVFDPDGRPVPYAVLKPAGEQRFEAAGVADADGRFDFAVEAFDRPSEKPAGTLSLRVFDPYRPLETKLTVSIDVRPGEPLTVRLEPSPIPPPPGPTTDEPRYVSVSLGRSAPELAGRKVLNGNGPVRLADHRGKFVLLDFWTVWCGPCRRQKPEVEAAARLYADRLAVIGVHDNSVPPETIAADVKENGPAFPTVIDTADDETTRRYGVEAFPTYVLIGPDGRVLLTSGHNGEALWADLLPTLRSYLYGPKYPEPVEAPRP